MATGVKVLMAAEHRQQLPYARGAKGHITSSSPFCTHSHIATALKTSHKKQGGLVVECTAATSYSTTLQGTTTNSMYAHGTPAAAPEEARQQGITTPGGMMLLAVPAHNAYHTAKDNTQQLL